MQRNRKPTVSKGKDKTESLLLQYSLSVTGPHYTDETGIN